MVEGHITELDGEIARLCGGECRENDSVPVTPSTPQQLADLTLQTALDADISSVPMLGRQYLDWALTTTDLNIPPVSLTEATPPTATVEAAIQWHQRADYALGVAGSYLGGEEARAVETMRSYHRDVAAELASEAATALQSLPVGFQFTEAVPAPTDPPSAISTALSVAADTASWWLSQASSTDSVQWREVALINAARAGATARELVSASARTPAEAGFPVRL